MKATNLLEKAAVLRRRPKSPVAIGSVFLVATAILMVLLYLKNPIGTFFRPGETITAEFGENYGLAADETVVKVAGLESGVVDSIERTDHGTVLVSMKVDESAVDALGSHPSAAISPKTILGGQYSVELRHGGGSGTFDGEFIPLERTRLPVELDRVLEALPGATRESLQNVVRDVDKTLARGGVSALRGIFAEAPETLKPARTVFEAAQGTRPRLDLPQIVTNFHTTADVLSKYEGQLGNIVTSLRDTSRTLAEQSTPLANGIEYLPPTLRATRTGMTDLRVSLDKLTTTAGAFRPSARELDSVLAHLDPVLREGRPLIRDLRTLAHDARPMVEQLVPAVRRSTDVLDDLRGPVLPRINGPITDTVMNTWRGSGPYKYSGGGMQADHKFYEELGYLVANMDRGSQTQDVHGTMIGFQFGANTRSVQGVPFTLPNLIGAMQTFSGGAR